MNRSTTKPDASPNRPDRARRRFWFRVAIALGLAMFIAYMGLTSSLFLTRVVMPKAGDWLRAGISAESARLRPFSSVNLKTFALALPGQEPFLRAERIQARYNLRHILGGDIDIQSLSLVSPRLRLVQNEDGSLNIDPWLASLSGTSAVPPGAAPGPPSNSRSPTLRVRNLELTNAFIELIVRQKDGGLQTFTLSGAHLTLDQLVTGQPGALAVALGLKAVLHDPESKTDEVYQGAMETKISFSLDSGFVPQFVRGMVRLELFDAPAVWRRFIGSALALDLNLTPAQVAKFKARLLKSGETLGELDIHGPFDFQKLEGRLAADLSGIDRRLLELAGESRDYNFNETRLSLHNDFDLSDGARRIKVTGTLGASRLSVTDEPRHLTTPLLEARLDYGLKIRRDLQTALVEKLVFDGQEDGAVVLTTTLSKPMTVSWGSGARAPENALLAVVVSGFDFSRWSLLSGGMIPRGKLNAAFRLASHEGEKHLAADLTAQFQDLSVAAGAVSITNLDVDLQLEGHLENLRVASLKNYRAAVALAGQNALTIEGFGQYNLKKRSATGTAVISGDLPPVLKLAAVPDIDLSTGGFRIDAQLDASHSAQQVSAMVLVTNATGRAGPATLDRAGLTVQAAARLRDKTIGLKQFSAKLDQAGQPALTLDAQGNYGVTAGRGDVDVSLEGGVVPLQQTFPGLRLGLTTGGLKFNGQVAAGADSVNLTGLISLTGLSGRVPGAELSQVSVILDTDAALETNTVILRKVIGSVTRAGRSGGQFVVAGGYNLTNDTARARLELKGINQDTLAPFLASAFDGLKLTQAHVDTTATAVLDATGGLALAGDVGVTNLVFQTVKSGKSNAPISTRIHVDGSFHGWLADLRSMRLEFPPTARAANRLELSGPIDFRKEGVMGGKLVLNSDGIDLTPWYDSIAARETNKVVATPAAKSGANTKETEPSAVLLPLEDLVIETKIDRLFLREISAANLHGWVKAGTNEVAVEELRLLVNGAPLEAGGALDFSVPGFRYRANLQATNLPWAPLSDSFYPEDRGKVQGILNLQSRAQGAGFLPEDFKRNLSGEAWLSFTNGGIQVMNRKIQIILLPVSLVLRIPEIINSPLRELDCRVQVTNASVMVERVGVVSAAFAGSTSGTLRLEETAVDSAFKSWPVEFMLARPLAKRADLMPFDTPTNAAYVKLPVFLKLKGTMADPKLDVSELAVARILVSSTTGILTKPAGALLREAEHLFKLGGMNAKTNTFQTNAPPARVPSSTPGPPPK